VSSREVDQPQWLTPTERQAWLTLSRLTMRLPTALDNQLQRDAGLSYFEYMVLAILSEQPERTMRMSSLAFIVNGSLSRLSHVVKRLERQAWVHREPDPRDGRYTNAILTSSGWEKVVSAAPGHVRTVRELVLDPLGADGIRQLHEAGQRVVQRVDPDSGCPGGS
jgi:DNA-binding MarR family transcriptional regulator